MTIELNQFYYKIKNMKKVSLLLCMLVMLACARPVQAQLYSYVNALDGTPAAVAPNAGASNLTRVNGAVSSAGCPDGFNSNKFSEGTTFLVSRPAIEFSIAPLSGYQLDITGITVEARRNNKGPVSWRLAYSVDGGVTWVDNGSDYTVDAVSCGTSLALTWDFADFSSTASLIFRVYAYGAASNLNGIATVRNVNLAGAVNFTDADSDGFTSDVDCNDFDAAVNPAAAELCNGIDDNCNGIVDEGAELTVYADADDDGFGNPAVSIEACDLIPGYVLNNDDCNDAIGSINPDGVEVCNGLDDDCDGDIDGGLLLTFYADLDDDGFGALDVTIQSCSAPVGYVNNSLDCNDANAEINPAASEVCNGVDDNCNGSVDEGLFLTFYFDADADGFGTSDISTESCSAPAGYVANNLDCNDANPDVNPAATEICNGIDDNCDAITDNGLLNTYYADADGDGFGNVASMIEACTAPVGYVGNSDDCNDASAAVNPSALEICDNGIDDNCDGVVDLSASITALGPTTFCSGGSVTLSCTTPAVDAAYQWFKNGNPIAGATASNYTTLVQGNYRCQVTSGACVVNTSVITVTVNLTPNATIATLDGVDLCGKAYVRLRGNNGTGLTYQWYLNGTLLAGATSQLYFATTVGSYKLRVTNASGCSKFSTPVSVFSSCREAFEEQGGALTIMPNPSAGHFTLQLPTTQNSGDLANVMIYSQAGSMVYQNGFDTTNGSIAAEITLDPVPGLYIVVVEAGGIVYREKLLIVQ